MRAVQRLTAWLHQLNLRPKGAPPTDTDGTVLPEKELQTRLFDLEEMRFARLCFFLQFRRPDAGDRPHILIYRLSDLEVGVAESAPLPLLEEAAAAQETR